MKTLYPIISVILRHELRILLTENSISLLQENNDNDNKRFQIFKVNFEQQKCSLPILTNKIEIYQNY